MTVSNFLKNSLSWFLVPDKNQNEVWNIHRYFRSFAYSNRMQLLVCFACTSGCLICILWSEYFPFNVRITCTHMQDKISWLPNFGRRFHIVVFKRKWVISLSVNIFSLIPENKSKESFSSDDLFRVLFLHVRSVQ